MLGGTKESPNRVEFDTALSDPRSRWWPWIVTAILLFVVTAIHLNLYLREDYNKIPTIGWLFLLTAVSGVVLAVGVLVRPRALTEAVAGLFAIGVLGAYLLTLLLPNGLFSFKEPGISYSGLFSIVAESAIVLLSILVLSRRWRVSSHPKSIVLTA